MFRSCPKSAGQTQCVLGQCTCQQGYCPADFETEQRLSNGSNGSNPIARASKCIPQVCFEGATPGKQRVSIWSRIFSGSVGNPSIPRDVIREGFEGTKKFLIALINSDDPVFATLLLFWPCFLLLLGFFVTGEMLYKVEFHTSRKMKAIHANPLDVSYTEYVVDGRIQAYHMNKSGEVCLELRVELADLDGMGKDLNSGFEDKIEEFLSEYEIEEGHVRTKVVDATSKRIKWPGKLPADKSKWPMTCRFEPEHHDEEILRPQAVPMLSLVVFTLAMAIGVARILAHRNLDNTLNLLDDSIGRAHNDTLAIARLSMDIVDAAVAFNASLQDYHETCHAGNHSILAEFNSEVMPALDGYMRMVDDILSYLEKAPSTVEKVHRAFRKGKFWFGQIPEIPTWVITFLCGFMVLEALVVRVCNRSGVARDVDITLKIVAFLFALGILAVTVVAVVEGLGGIFVGLFCMDVDNNVLLLVNVTEEAKGFNFTEGYNITRHYLYGDVVNPITEHVHQTDKMIFDIVSAYAAFPVTLERIVEFVIQCPVTKFFHVKAMSEEVRKFLRGVAPLFDNAHLYPYYQMIIREGMCNSFVDGLGWLLVAQLVVGLICFPLCIAFTHKYLTRCFIWQWAEENARKANNAGDEDDSDSGDTSEETSSELTSRPLLGEGHS